MVFSSAIFLVYFLPIFLGLYFLADKKYKNAIILIASTIFYAWGAPKFVFLLLASTFLDFYLVKWMDAASEERRKKLLLTLSITLNLGLLAYFKYANFFIENVNALLGSLGGNGFHWTEVILPIGISFYTFQTLTYSIDVYRKHQRPLDRVGDYMLYIMMFPQLIAGPIVRYNHIADQIRERDSTMDERLTGFYRFCIGLGKKVLIANVLGEQADRIMAMEYASMDSTTAWIGILAYTFQIYFDFSGYSDMAIGIGKMLGFKFPENFDNPYISKSISEFWRRWHITLGAWMRDYLYIPLGGNRVSSTSRLYFNLWFVFLVSGLWHGASWNFVLWGAYHGFFLVIERLFLGRFLKWTGPIVALPYAIIASVMGWVIFRIEDASAAWVYYQRLWAFDFRPIAEIENIPLEFWTMFCIGTFFAFFLLLPKGKQIQDAIFFKRYSNIGLTVMFFVAWSLFILSLSSLTASDFNPFIYFRF